LNSADFEATDRGRGSRINAYSVAVEVFGRDVSCDPQTDPIVRIEEGHLRRSLERYYLTAGQTDPILITIPKGGYVPAFSFDHSRPLRTYPKPPLLQQSLQSRRGRRRIGSGEGFWRWLQQRQWPPGHGD
jgi:hypothetical protein